MEREPGGRFHRRVGEVQLESFAFTWRDKERDGSRFPQHARHTVGFNQLLQTEGAHSVVKCLAYFSSFRLYMLEISLYVCAISTIIKFMPLNFCMTSTLLCFVQLNLAK